MAKGAPLYYAATLTIFVAASTAPTPLYRLYQEAWGLTSTMVTVVFAVYALALLAALLTLGSLSDRLGRRPVIFLALVVEGASMVAFAGADRIWLLLLARLLQGIATGAATSALAAAIMDLAPGRAPLINGIAPLLGMTLGVLGSAVLVTFGPAPTRLVYWTLLAVFVLLMALIWLTTEPRLQGRGRGGKEPSGPRWALPEEARRGFWRVTPTNLAVWALGGFYLSLVPSVVRVSLHSTSALVGGSVVASLTAMGTLAVFTTRRRPSNRAMVEGPLALAAGVSLSVAGVSGQILGLVYLGTAVAGFGWGMSFLGVLGSLVPLVGARDRARLMALYYVQSYCAMSIPTVAVGMLATNLGLTMATLVYGTALILLALGAVGLSRGATGQEQGLPPKGVACPEET
ncbi:MFS transporter [Rhodospirillum sp. A1_3_36]|uniref:MFS transporter n=1 Tax=Rhodospirillum sp. A1_3_36 TaxID=3391666 RepID=UPI0039A508C0